MPAIFSLMMLFSLAAVSAADMRITTDAPGYEYTIFSNGRVAEELQVGRSDLGQCHAVPRFVVGPGTRNLTIYISDSSSPMAVSGRIQRNSNGALVHPSIVFGKDKTNPMFVPQTVAATVELRCDSETSREPWAFVAVEVTDAGRKVEFEVLKICDSSVYSSFDWSVVALLAMTIVVVAVASLAPVPMSLETKKDRNTVRDEPKAELTVGLVISFVLVGSGVLLLAFFYTTVFLFVFTIGICISGTFMIGIYLFQLIQMSFRPCPSLRAAILRKVLYKELTIAEVAGYCLALLLFVVWLYTKHWLINNVIGIFFILCFVRIVRVKSLMVSTLLLGSLFVYDIFWVFFSAPIFGGNVMATVATKLELPIKLLMPHFNPMPSTQCMLIGLGDLVIPGVVIAFAYKLSIRLRTKMYYVSSLAAYVLALVVCEAVLYAFQTPQPALLYISPLVLSALYLSAALRKELRTVWRGVKANKEMLAISQPSVQPQEIELFPVHRAVN